jgi:hypothetical protein
MNPHRFHLSIGDNQQAMGVPQAIEASSRIKKVNPPVTKEIRSRPLWQMLEGLNRLSEMAEKICQILDGVVGIESAWIGQEPNPAATY